MKSFLAAIFLATAALTLTTAVLSAHAAPEPVVILLSAEVQAYQEATKAFAEQINHPLEFHTITDGAQQVDKQMKAIVAEKPPLIFAVGAKAAYAAKIYTQDHQHIPVLFAMVLNWQRYHLLNGQRNIIGIATEMPPSAYLRSIRLLTPSVRKVGIIYNSATYEDIIIQARQDAKALNLELVTVPIARGDEFSLAFKSIEDNIDGFWLLPDPTFYTLTNIEWLQNRCSRLGIVCLGSSQNLAASGTLLGLTPQYRDIGSQAAQMAKLVLERHCPLTRIQILPPLNTEFLVNMKTAAMMGLPITSATIAAHNELSLWWQPAVAINAQ